MKNILYTLIASLFFIGQTIGQIDRSKQPKPGPAPTINLGTPNYFELKNGLKIMVVENHKLPRVNVTLSIVNGPILEGKKVGVRNLTSSLLGSGTENISKDDFNKKVDFLGANLNFSSQGASLNTLSKYFPEMLELMADGVKNPIFNQEEFDKQQIQLIEGIKSNKNSVDAIAGTVQNALVYGKNHPSGEFATVNSVEKVTLEDVKTFYDTYFRPNNAYLVVTGDIKYRNVKKQITKAFENWASGKIPSYQVPTVVNVETTEVDIIDMPNAVQSNISISNAVYLKKADDDFYAALLANYILGSNTGRLFKNLREEKGYTYGANSRIGNDHETASRFNAFASVGNMVTDSSVVEFIKEINKIKSEKVTGEELSNAKAAYTGSFVRALESPSTAARYALNIEIENLPKDYYEVYLKRLNDVTVEDIQKVANKYFKSENFRIIIVGKGADIVTGLEKLPYPINYFDKYANPASKPEMTKSIPEGVTKQTVFDNYVTAIGGATNVNSVKTVYNKSEATMQGMLLTTETKSMAPNKQSVIMTGMGMVLSKMIFDGEKGYSEQQGVKKELAGAELDKINSNTVPFPEINYINDAQVSLEKIEPVNGSDAYVIKTSDDTSIYYDVVSGLKVKQVVEIKQGEQTFQQVFDFLNYKEVDGVKFPHTIKMIVGPQKFDFEVKEIRINKDVSESDFQ